MRRFRLSPLAKSDLADIRHYIRKIDLGQSMGNIKVPPCRLERAVDNLETVTCNGEYVL